MLNQLRKLSDADLLATYRLRLSFYSRRGVGLKRYLICRDEVLRRGLTE